MADGDQAKPAKKVEYSDDSDHSGALEKQDGNSTFLTALGHEVERKQGPSGANRDEGSCKANVSGPLAVPGMERVRELHGQLSQVASGLSKKISGALKEQESEFLSAYRAHMYNVQKELQELRSKVKNAELEVQRDQAIVNLTKERDWFRSEALHLDTVAANAKKELKYMEEKLKGVEEDRNWLEAQLKKAKRQNKLLKSELEIHLDARAAEERAKEIGAAQEHGRQATPPGEALAQLVSSTSDSRLAQKSRKQLLRSKTHSESLPIVEKDTGSREQDNGDGLIDLRRQVKSLNKQLLHERQSVKQLRANAVAERANRGELESFFNQCIEETKREIAKRKAAAQRGASRSKRSAGAREASESPRLNQVHAVTFKSFSRVDRRRVIERFLMHGEAYSVLHRQLFPTEYVDDFRMDSSIYLENQCNKPDADLPQLLNSIS